ncbi:hypothetical protein GDN83_00905 [Gordonia jinghuaiqii]|uniref:Uncharacterized protein n=1 Tax=Gordonia jinghuaiqii TaxID=2758710 RepID=A0A7D7RT98_9ACTN|nr:hypothetical protein [Gordonia jinghuaiqii]MCR5976335.1 hypothetical protein [Gordonia jinghuaiqii]QMT03553.1 hypothetical protein H1R19_10980 [Gordonia jinghuaiqii]
MNATQCNVLEKVAVDELAARFGAVGGPMYRSAIHEASDSITPALSGLVELGLVTPSVDSASGYGVRITPAGVEALAYLASDAV